MASSLLKLRSDLTVSEHKTIDGSSFVIKEPNSGNFFRLGEAEHFIVQQFDGKTPADDIRKRGEEKFEAEISKETLDAFVAQLQKRGLLEREDQKPKKTKKRISGNPLYARFRAIDPTRLFDHMLPRLWFFFTPSFVVLSASLILLATGTIIAHRSEFLADLSHFHFSSLPLLMSVIFVVAAAHECAHGLTCRHFGGEVHEIGFMLIYFQPAMYCNVSDAWLFPEKSKRLWVGFAGPYFESFIWALSVFVWRVTDVETWINNIALIIVATSGVKILLNIHPLVKLDGYYLLSDYLEIPNLRRRSFKYVGDLLRICFGIPATMAEGLAPRLRRIYLVYGVLATMGTVSILVYVLLTAGGYLVEDRQPTVVLLSMVMLGMKFRRRFRRLFGRKSASADEFDDFEDEDADTDEPPKSNSTHSKSPKTKTETRISSRQVVWLGALCVICAISVFGRIERRVSGQFNALPRENADVRAAVEGIVEKVFVDEGDEVKTGDLIAKLFDHDLQTELQKVESDLASKQARLRMLVTGARPEEIELARKQVETSHTKNQQASDLYLQAKHSRDERLSLTETSIKKAEERLMYGEKSLNLQQTLMENGLGALLQFDTAAEEVAVRKKELEEARAQRQVLLAEDLAEIRKDVAITEREAKESEARLEVLLAGSRREEIDALQADIASSDAQRVLLREQLDRTRVLSPATGVVATSSRVLKEMTGQLLKKGDLIAKVYDFKTVAAQILVSEKEIEGVNVGQPVVLRARAYPNQTFRGTVTEIATSARGNSGETSSSSTEAKLILVTTQIDNESLLLKPEMTGQAKIFTGRWRILDLVTRRAMQTVKVDFWSWW